MMDMMGVNSYRNQVSERYRSLRETVLSTDSLVNRFRTMINNLDACGAIDREESRWSGDSDINWKKLDIRAEMDYVENWIRSRMTYLDENEFKPGGDGPDYPDPDPIIGDVNGDEEVNIADVNLLIDIILGGADNTEGRSDVNSDGEANIADINAVIDIILNN